MYSVTLRFTMVVLVMTARIQALSMAGVRRNEQSKLVSLLFISCAEERGHPTGSLSTFVCVEANIL
jgi:hypothetical protein